jgi:glycine/D-amino acid oxidase-like deaminating enzyme
MKPSSSILVVGGGEFGLTAALELRRRGHGVTLIDPGPLPHPDAASTDISKVIRADYGTEEFYMDMMEEAFADWEAWKAGWDRPLYHPTGVLFITSQAFQPGGFEYESHDRLRRRGYQLEPLDRRALVESFPAWRPTGEVAGYYNLRGGWADSRSFTSAHRTRTPTGRRSFRSGHWISTQPAGTASRWVGMRW